MLDIGSRRELFVDDTLIERMDGVDLRLHHPTPREIVLVHDAPWEGNSCNYYTVLQDGDRYRMYYRGSEQALKDDPPPHPSVMCYAESTDGIHWEKPDLGLVEYGGSRDNNIFYAGPCAEAFVPFVDANPDCRPEGRYKALGTGPDETGHLALYAFRSPDGIHWSPMGDEPVATEGAFDSQNLAFWDPNVSAYRAYWRGFRDLETGRAVGFGRSGRVRDILTATSDDLLHWSDPAWLEYPGAPDEELYTNQVLPYFRAPHIYLGFPTRYLDRGWSDSMRALPGLAHRELRSATSPREGTALTDGLLMSSRDGRTFTRWREAFLRPGLRTANNWAYGDNYQGWGIVETKAMVEDAPDELSIYVTEAYWMPEGSRLRRFTLRVDGFVSAQAPGAGGELLTRPFVFAGCKLALNFATSAAGSIRVEVQDRGGQPLPGFALQDCSDLFGDDLERTVTWKEGWDVGKLAGQPVRLRFAMQDADLYALRFSGDCGGVK
jgi:hypothetical protein